MSAPASTGDVWFYYLHTNGGLIAKKFRPDPSDFVRRIWSINTADRRSCYVLLVEAACLGASMKRVLELAKHWGADGDDGLVFCKHMGFVCAPHESEAGRGYIVHHKEDGPERSRGEGSSPLLALISYTRQGDFAQEAA